ncbi:hypothetical protein GCM10007862_07090 [Dyella lipolytica]|uniref:DUF4224 domain-containing protein n=1 Tax=Dyella lipolytica TaxID=1867835 RepID=A0ABW8IYE8_9GAMM|nr:DUF4224 domain-containing protein [Dyella lipolytica]GLQ45658.1 hypothetical protein GCM10007862_07090 [Dyella lipolytica]
MSICLSRDELAELCRTSRKAGQIAFLRLNGIRHYLDAYGWPVVTRAAIGIPQESDAAPAPRWRPNKCASVR